MNTEIKDILTSFLAQAKTDNLKTKQYPNDYSLLKMKVSFGQGNLARIPWISFLGKGQTTPNGIYPVFLLFKEYGILILAYGISEENRPVLSWNLPSSQKTITEYFASSGKTAERYGNSYIYAVYDVNDKLNWDEIEKDLQSLIQLYKEIIDDSSPAKIDSQMRTEFNVEEIKSAFKDAGYFVSDKTITRFVASLLTKPFVILTGLSGSGKTKLALAFSKWICRDDNQMCVVPVGADWTSREPLLGYANALEQGKYVSPECGALNLILEASKEENQNKPFFLILDEMNLSHVERYFADFLSAMESNESISLHHDSEMWDEEIPAKVFLPKNLFILGTVNIDETTYMFSPKVLDRANVLEFRITQDEMAEYLKSNTKLDIEMLRSQGSNMAESFVELASKDFEYAESGEIADTLLEFFKVLKQSGAEFGYRSAAEIVRFAGAVKTIEPEWTVDDILDAATMQKLLPKVHGSRRKLESVLKALGNLCMQVNVPFESALDSKRVNDYGNKREFRYAISAEKIVRMHRSLIDNGFTSYAEA